MHDLKKYIFCVEITRMKLSNWSRNRYDSNEHFGPSCRKFRLCRHRSLLRILSISTKLNNADGEAFKKIYDREGTVRECSPITTTYAV